MDDGKMKISEGVAALLANAHNPVPSVECYYFKGDLCQMAKASEAARDLGIEVQVGGGVPYVRSKVDYDTVAQYLILHRIDGYGHYIAN